MTVCWWNFFLPVVRTCSPDLKTYFTKISVSGGPCNIHFCFFLCAYYSFRFLNVITAKRPLKLDLLATSFNIPATICSLVFYCVSFVPTFRLLFNFKMVDSQIGTNLGQAEPIERMAEWKNKKLLYRMTQGSTYRPFFCN